MIAFTLAALIIALSKPIANLSPLGHNIMAVVLVTIGLWIFWYSAMAYLAGGSLAFGLTLPVVAVGFTSSAVWVCCSSRPCSSATH